MGKRNCTKVVHMERTGAKVVIDGILEAGTDVIFGIPGGAVIDLYDDIYHSELKHILMRHEQCAAHAADGYARASGKVGVAVATSGPGATNLVTGLTNAQMDSIPVVAFTGQVPKGQIGTDAFQEANTFGITMPVTKHNFLVRNVNDLPWVVKAAFTIANTGRKGPVVVDLPKDIQTAKTRKRSPEKIDFKGYRLPGPPGIELVNRIARLILRAERPVILAGGGVVASGASEELYELANMLMIPVGTTLMGKGVFPENHPLSLGMAGHHGRYGANNMIIESDLLLSIGVRFSDRTTGWKLAEFAPDAVKIHVDIDWAEINKNIDMDIAVVSDAKSFLRTLLSVLNTLKIKKPNFEWHSKADEFHKACEVCPKYFKDDAPIKPERVIKELNELLPDDAIITTEVGQTQMFAAHYYLSKQPRTFITSGGLGTMGFGFPASIGAKVAKPDNIVVDMAGDGSFLMTSQDLATTVSYDIPVIVVIFNNNYLGMVRQWQEIFYERRYSDTHLQVLPDFVKFAEAFGAYGAVVEKPGDIKDAVKGAIDSGKPSIIDVHVEKEANVLPMIPPGGGYGDMIGLDECPASRAGKKEIWRESRWRRI